MITDRSGNKTTARRRAAEFLAEYVDEAFDAFVDADVTDKERGQVQQHVTSYQKRIFKLLRIRSVNGNNEQEVEDKFDLSEDDSDAEAA